jgi:hypothetical protein
MRRSRKASLDLSVNSIITFVLAFAMLGVGLYFTNMIKDKIANGTIKVLDSNNLENPADPQNPVTIPREVTLRRGGKLTLDIGFYNSGNSQADAATVKIDNCLREDNTPVPADQLPTLASPSEDVATSSDTGFRTILRDTQSHLDPMTYICVLQVYNFNDATEVYEKKQFFLTVTK